MEKTFCTVKELAAKLCITSEGVRQKVYRGELNTSVVRNIAGRIQGFYLEDALLEVDTKLEAGRKRREFRSNRKCEGCGSAYFPTNLTQKYCSVACGAVNRTKYTEEQRNAQLNISRQKYAERQSGKAQQLREEQLKNVFYECEHCSKHYNKVIGENLSSKYCSKACARLAHNKQRTDRDKKGKYSILNRDAFKCVYCNSSSIEDGARLTVDHLIPISKGGSNNPNNLVTACRDCNISKNAQDLSPEIFNRLTEIVIKRNAALSESDKAFIEKIWDNITSKRIED
jgi:5-methylcytosine-specific restriction endonuclease McrA